MHDFLNQLLGYLSAHPLLAYFLIFLNAIADSLPFIGVLIPGTVIIFGVGVVVATGILSLKPVIFAAILGAIVGDSIGYWVGRRYKKRISATTFPRFAVLVAKGESYFKEHGGKSVFLARFIGPLRPIIPVVAGMSGMDSKMFGYVNFISAIGWAFAYIIPGLFFGSSLELAGAISTRLLIIILLVSALSWLFVVVSKKVLRYFEKHAPVWFEDFKHWAISGTKPGSSFRRVKRFIAFVIYRRQGEEILLLILGCFLLVAGWGFLLLLQDVPFKDPLGVADRAVYYFFRSLRTPWGDTFFVAVTELGDAFVNGTVAIVVVVVLLFKDCYRTAKYFLGTIIGGAIITEILKFLISKPKSVAIYHAALSHSFPSGHTTMSIILYGFLALIIARGIFQSFRWGFFVSIFLLPFMVAISRLYLGAHWFSDILGGFFVGIIWVSLLGISYIKRRNEAVPRKLLAVAVVATITLAGGWHIRSNYQKDIKFYSIESSGKLLSMRGWRSGAWETLDSWRVDMGGENEEPLDIQLAGRAENISTLLIGDGWEESPQLTLKLLLGLLSPITPLKDLPVLPHLHKGRKEDILLVKNSNGGRTVFRGWRASNIVDNGGIPIFIGHIEVQKRFHLTPLITIARSSFKDSNWSPISKETFTSFKVEEVKREGVSEAKWDGTTFLIEY